MSKKDSVPYADAEWMMEQPMVEAGQKARQVACAKCGRPGLAKKLPPPPAKTILCEKCRPKKERCLNCCLDTVKAVCDYCRKDDPLNWRCKKCHVQLSAAILRKKEDAEFCSDHE